jgi:hypothetical protein
MRLFMPSIKKKNNLLSEFLLIIIILVITYFTYFCYYKNIFQFDEFPQFNFWLRNRAYYPLKKIKELDKVKQT